ncbi:MAG: peptidoglycan hydrolase-like amidase [Verrucomicrobiales bacterium]|jgi:peptidoglycan hydrolase-like amidase
MHRFRAALAAVAVISVFAATMTTAGAQDEDPTLAAGTTDITGHGWGHGRGMSQYGAVGYALNFGWSSEQILDHYYGATTAGTVPDSILTVRIESASDKATVAQVDSGVVVLLDDEDNVTHVGTGGAVRLTAVAGGFVMADAPTCSGPFVDREGIVAAEVVRISTADTPQQNGSTGLTGTVGAGAVVMGDWDGDGDDEAGTADGTSWTLYNGALTSPAVSVRATFEMPPGIAVAGDWDGDEVDTAGVFADGTWSLGNGAANVSTLLFGEAGDTPIVGDWDGDGNDDLGVRRGNTWMLSPGGGAPVVQFDWGWLGDTPLVGDWDGDGIDDAGLLRARTWIRRPRIGTTLGDPLPELTYANKLRYLIGDWNGDGIDGPGRHDDGLINLDGPGSVDVPSETITPRLNPNLDLAETIQRCVSASEQRYYRGELRAVRNDGAQRTVNAVPVESYLRAVVPLEMPASWALLGDGAGAAALEAQAVSARSYSLGENRTAYALTCDTISCQVYGGRAVRRSGVLTSNEHVLSNAAILSTAGSVRIRDGEVARTEFSSSTGGWTAGGVFPAVEDLGDAVDINPNFVWTKNIEIADIEARWSGRRLDRIFVSERNGLGQDGGRVFEVTLEFGDETFTISGNNFRRAYGLKSDWFTIDWERESPIKPCICPRTWPDQALVDDLEVFEG